MSEAPKTRGRRIRTAVYAVYVAFAAGFVLLSTWSIVSQLFGLTAAPVATAHPAGPACADGIRALARALDRGVAASAPATDDADALARMRAALSPEWDKEQEIGAVCTSAPRGADAWAALMRLRRAEEGAATHHALDVAPVRRDVDAYLTP